MTMNYIMSLFKYCSNKYWTTWSEKLSLIYANKRKLCFYKNFFVLNVFYLMVLQTIFLHVFYWDEFWDVFGIPQYVAESAIPKVFLRMFWYWELPGDKTCDLSNRKLWHSEKLIRPQIVLQITDNNLWFTIVWQFIIYAW